MFSKFFIEHPVLSNVIAIVMMLLGVVFLQMLPVAQYPDIVPPTVQVSASYPGASPEVVAETVASPIEQQVNGVEGMIYMTSKSSSDGSYTLTVTFEVGVNLDMATVLVQNRVNQALSRLPQDVQRGGVNVQKKSTNMLLVASLESPDNTYDDLYLANYATLRIRDELTRIKGVGDVMVYGADEYAMRIWIDPDKLRSRKLSAKDLVNAVTSQNVQVASGQIGAPPVPEDQAFQKTIKTLGRLTEPSQFEDIIIKSDVSSGASRNVRVRDVARVELGGRSYDRFAEKNGKPATVIVVYLQPGANSLNVADAVKAKLTTVSKAFPPGLVYSIPYDTTLFVSAAVKDVYHTLIEAAVLVLIVILVFLQNMRAMLVPATTVPVTILGAFIAMAAFGFTVNLITLFGIILAIGIVVDDAIIVVEGAVHHMERGKNSHDAAIAAMTELFGPIIGITLVLTSVFLPTAFLPGISGQLFRQFALVIAATAIISAINAATLKPTQCALWLKPATGRKNAFYRAFDSVYEPVEAGYVRMVTAFVGRPTAVMIGYLALFAVSLWGFSRLPTGFLPDEDQGYLVAATIMPPGQSQSKSREAVHRLNEIIAKEPGVASWITMGGLSILDNANVAGTSTTFITLKPWDERGTALSADVIMTSLRRKFFGLEGSMNLIFGPPPIQGLGQAGGFELVVQDRGNLGSKALESAVRELAFVGSSQSGLSNLSATFSASNPQLYADINRTQALAYGVPLNDVFSTLQTFLGSTYINDFNIFGRVYQVRAQAESLFRLKPEDIGRLEVRNDKGAMVPLGSLVSIRDQVGAQVLTRYNLYTAASVFGAAAPGFSTGQAMKITEQMSRERLPSSMDFEWTSTAYQEKKIGNQAYLVFGLAVLLVYLVLAAQYESWLLPTAVILVVPLVLTGTFVALKIRGMDNNIYTQIGLVLLIALASKNAILIVEFARELRIKGMGLAEAAIAAAKSRFRPILMTSFAFILGVVPLLTSRGAGGASQRALGTAVFGGMIASTVIAVLVVPVFFVIVRGFSERLDAKKDKTGHA